MKVWPIQITHSRVPISHQVTLINSLCTCADGHTICLATISRLTRRNLFMELIKSHHNQPYAHLQEEKTVAVSENFGILLLQVAIGPYKRCDGGNLLARLVADLQLSPRA